MVRCRWNGLSEDDFRALASLVTEMTSDDLALIESEVSMSFLSIRNSVSVYSSLS